LGQVVVGVRPTLPVEGISLLLGNDMAGDKVIMDTLVSDEPSYEENELENTEVFPACSVTGTMRQKLKEEETLLQDGNTETSNVELRDTFLLMSTITFCIATAICLVILQTRTKHPV